MAQCHRAQPATHSGAVELHQVSHGATLSMACRKMPEPPGLCDFHSAMPGGLHELVDYTLAGAGEEERLVEVALAGQFSLPAAKAGILCDFPRAHLVEAHDIGSHLCGNCFEGRGDLCIEAAKRNTVIAGHTLRPFDMQIEVTLWDEDPAASLSDKGMGVRQLSPQDFQFCAGLTGDEDQRHSPPLNLLECFLGGRPGGGVGIEQRAIEVRENQVSSRQHDWEAHRQRFR